MESAAVVSAGHGVSLPVQSSRREWRVVSNHHSVHNAGEKDLECSKFGQTDERRIYEALQGRESVSLDYPITVDGSMDSIDLLQQRLHSVTRQRENLQKIEIELRARAISNLEITGIQNSCDAQIKEHVSAAAKLQEELRSREQTINELERKLATKEIELHDFKLANEAAWAKEDLLREQNKELATFRRELDNSEAERARHLSQLHELQERIQEKDRQFVELQEQNRVAKDSILFKDEQLREAQAWISRVQEMDALQSSTNHSLQTELRERTEQYNQLWLGCQRQFAEMERIHLHTMQQFQLELADARERSGSYTDESCVMQKKSKDVLQFGQNDGHQLDEHAGGTSSETSEVLPNGNADSNPSFDPVGNPSGQNNQVPGVPIAPSLLGMPSYLPPGQMTALHPFVMRRHSLPHSDAAHAGHFQPISGFSSLQHWQNQQGASESQQPPTHDPYPPPQTEHNLIRPDAKYNYGIPVNGHSLHPEYLNVHDSHVVEPDSVMPATEVTQVSEPIDQNYTSSSQPPQTLKLISSQFHDSLQLNSLEPNTLNNEKTVFSNHEPKPMEQPSSPLDSLLHPVKIVETMANSAITTAVMAPEAALLDEKSLLACIVRTIPPGSSGGIRISSTLPNRLSKMLAPLHWHDYKKMYGKLDDLVAGHPELFVIEEDYVRLRGGAQEMIAATAAVAKVAAAASASSPHSTLLPSVAVTPVAQSHRVKKNQHSNGAYGSGSSIKILSKPKDALESNGLVKPEGLVLGNSQNKG